MGLDSALSTERAQPFRDVRLGCNRGQPKPEAAALLRDPLKAEEGCLVTTKWHDLLCVQGGAVKASPGGLPAALSSKVIL